MISLKFHELAADNRWSSSWFYTPMVSSVASRVLHALAVLLITSTTALAQVTSYAFVPNAGSDTVTVADLSTNTVVATVAVGDDPRATAFTPDGRLVYVVNKNDSTVTVLDTATRNVVGSPIPVGFGPYTIAITPDGSKAYVGNFDGQTVSVLDLTTNTVTTTIVSPALTPFNRPIDIAITPDGATAYVVAEDAGLVPIDVATDTADVLIPTGGSANGVALHGQTAWVAQLDAVAIVDLPTKTVVDTVVTNDGTHWDVAISPDGAHAYATSFNNANVAVIDTATRTVVANVPTASSPTAVAFANDGSNAYVANSASHNISVISVATHTPVTTIPTGNTPYGSGGAFASPNIVSGPALTIASDADLEANHFRSFVPMSGGGLQATADWTTPRTLSILWWGGYIDTNGFDVTIDGGVSNDGIFNKVGAGTLTLNGTSTHAGGTLVHPDSGTLIVNGTHSGLISLGNNTTLGGTGTVGTIQTSLSTISPGGVGPGVTTGILHATNVDLFAPSTVAIEVKGSAPGTGYDQLDVSGTAALDNAFLVVDASGFSPMPAQQFTIVKNATGHFKNPEGSMVPGGSGNRFRITYTGGDGNDVVLTADVEAPQIVVPHTLTIDEDAGLVSLPFTVSDDVFQGSEILTAVNESTNAALLPQANVSIVGAGASRTLQLTTVPHASGTSLVGIRASDGALRSTGRSILLTVNPVNDPPTISAIGAQSVPENTPLDPIAFTVGDIDNDVDTLTVTATSSNQNVVPDANLVIGGSGGPHDRGDTAGRRAGSHDDHADGQRRNRFHDDVVHAVGRRAHLLSRGRRDRRVLRYRHPARESKQRRDARGDPIPDRRWRVDRGDAHAAADVADDDSRGGSRRPRSDDVLDDRHVDECAAHRRRADDALGCVGIRRPHGEGEWGSGARVVLRGRLAGLLLDVLPARESACDGEYRARDLLPRRRARADARL
jgi:YVTN family beta-propeller protein/autotransporter-associated beta strand protein